MKLFAFKDRRVLRHRSKKVKVLTTIATSLYPHILQPHADYLDRNESKENANAMLLHPPSTHYRPPMRYITESNQESDL